METNELIKKLDTQVPGAVLETRPFGRSSKKTLWVEMCSIRSVASILAGASFGFDWLENFSVMEIEGALVLTYILRSSRGNRELILRGSVVPRSSEEEAEAQSVSSVWPMIRQQEVEAADLFGIKFEGLIKHTSVLPSEWKGYPLRKTYRFPKTVSNIGHSRPVGKSLEKEEGR